MKASRLSRETAAKVWCRDDTKHIEMDTVLCEAFAEVLEEVWSKPWLGNATNRQILEELAARVNLDYKTVGEDIPNPAVFTS